MSLKENVELVKEELNSEEKFFEKAVVTERFIKKYKKALIGGAIAIVLVAFGNVAYDIKEKNRIESANKELAKLIKNPSDTKALSELKSLSPKLYNLWSFSNAAKNNDIKELSRISKTNLSVISDISSYLVASNEQKVEALDSYTLKQDAIYKDFADIQSAIIYLKNNDKQKADMKLATISDGSSLKSIATMLSHYGVK